MTLTGMMLLGGEKKFGKETSGTWIFGVKRPPFLWVGICFFSHQLQNFLVIIRERRDLKVPPVSVGFGEVSQGDVTVRVVGPSQPGMMIFFLLLMATRNPARKPVEVGSDRVSYMFGGERRISDYHQQYNIFHTKKPGRVVVSGHNSLWFTSKIEIGVHGFKMGGRGQGDSEIGKHLLLGSTLWACMIGPKGPQHTRGVHFLKHLSSE